MSSVHVKAILTAAGRGDRFKKSSLCKSIPKQFLKLNQKPVILYSLLALENCKQVDEIFVSCADEYIDLIDSIASKNKISKLTMFIEGGKTRFQSVKNAFNQIIAENNDLVLIHDAVRPNITPSLIDELIDNIGRKDDGIVIGNKINDTVKRVKNEHIYETIDRSELWTVQTPQIFKYSVLKNSYKKAGRKKDFTDESAMVEAAGYKMRIYPGPEENIKITVPKDIELLNKLWKK